MNPQRSNYRESLAGVLGSAGVVVESIGVRIEARAPGSIEDSISQIKASFVGKHFRIEGISKTADEARMTVLSSIDQQCLVIIRSGKR